MHSGGSSSLAKEVAYSVEGGFYLGRHPPLFRTERPPFLGDRPMQNVFNRLCGRLQAVDCFEVLPYNLENFVLCYSFGNEITSLGPDHFSTTKINFHAKPPVHGRCWNGRCFIIEDSRGSSSQEST